MKGSLERERRRLCGVLCCRPCWVNLSIICGIGDTSGFMMRGSVGSVAMQRFTDSVSSRRVHGHATTLSCMTHRTGSKETVAFGSGLHGHSFLWLQSPTINAEITSCSARTAPNCSVQVEFLHVLLRFSCPLRLQPRVHCLWPAGRSILRFLLQCQHALRLQCTATERDGSRSARVSTRCRTKVRHTSSTSCRSLTRRSSSRNLVAGRVSHALQHLGLAEHVFPPSPDEFCVNAVCDGSIDEKGAAISRISSPSSSVVKYSPGMHRAQTPGVGTRLPSQTCVKRWEAKRVAKWSCASFFVPIFVLRDDECHFKFLFCPRGRACRVALNAEGHMRKSARAERSKFRYPLRLRQRDVGLHGRPHCLPRA